MSSEPVQNVRSGYVQAVRDRTFYLYEGRLTPHRSCGIALAETFGLPTRSYQALRRGGLSGLGTCGAALAGTLVLGEILGDPDPTGAPTPLLRRAIPRYREILTELRARRGDGLSPEASCNTRVGGYADFTAPERRGYCTDLATDAAEAVARTLEELGVSHILPTIPQDRPTG